MPHRRTRGVLALAAALALGASALGGCAAQTRAAPPVRSVRELIETGDRDFDRRAYVRALESYRLAALAADGAGNDAQFVEAASQASSVLSLQGIADEALGWYERAYERSSSDRPSGWTRLLMARGLLDWKNGRDGDALATFSELYGYCYLHRRTVRAVQAAQLATIVAPEDEQLLWAQRAIDAAKTTGDPLLEAPLWSNLGWLLDDRGLFDEALPAFARALELTTRGETSRLGRARAEWAFAHALRTAGRYPEAQERLEELLAVTTGLYVRERSKVAAEYLGRTLMDLAELDLVAGRRARARQRFELARTRLIEAGAPEHAPDLLAEIEARLHAIASMR